MHYEGKAAGSKDRVPPKVVTAVYGNVSVLGQLEVTNDFDETICRLSD
ncbi:MAG: hypothetical protein OXF76_18540 [Caldilineaceae bacterium]|nr:hypothetical protein [Caldilineaceae bacterium]